MDEWLNLTGQERRELNPGTVETARGVVVRVFMSPNDVPEAVRGRYDHARKRFVIDFRYISSEEPTEERVSDEYLSLQIGRHSGRLYGLAIDVDALKAKSVSLEMLTNDASEVVDRALRNLIAHPPVQRRADNYRVADEVIKTKRARLFEALEAE